MRNKGIVRKACSEIRNMFLEFEVEELVTEGSIIPEEEVVKTLDPRIHEACKYIPIFITYGGLDGGEIRNIDQIRGIVEKTGAKGYILGSSMSFNVPGSGGGVLVANFSVNFYKLREQVITPHKQENC